MPSLLKNIIYEITSDTNDINSIMRKCLYLACKLGDKDFIRWVKNEVSGYSYYCEDIPEYRYRQMLFKGEFRKESGERDHIQLDPILLFANQGLHKENINMFFPPRITGSISNIHYHIEHGGYHQVLMSDATLTYCKKLRKDKLECLSVYQEFPVGTLISVIENIKIRVLEIVLELERKIPSIHEIIAIESTLTIDNEVRNIVNNVFNNTINGNANISNASENFNQNIQLPSDELINKLLSELLQLKKQGKDVDTIDTVIPKIEEMKHIKDQKGIIDKLANIMTIAGGSASVFSLVAQYIPAISKLVG